MHCFPLRILLPALLLVLLSGCLRFFDRFPKMFTALSLGLSFHLLLCRATGLQSTCIDLLR